MSQPSTRFVQQYGQMTLAQLKELNYRGQGQIQPGDQLWKAHLSNQAHKIAEELEREGGVKKELPEMEIARWKYEALKRWEGRQGG